MKYLDIGTLIYWYIGWNLTAVTSMVTKRHFTFETTNFIEQNGINGKKCHVSSIVSVLEAAFELTPTLGDRFRGIRRARGSKVTLVQTGLTEEVNHNGTPRASNERQFCIQSIAIAIDCGRPVRRWNIVDSPEASLLFQGYRLTCTPQKLTGFSRRRLVISQRSVRATTFNNVRNHTEISGYYILPFVIPPQLFRFSKNQTRRWYVAICNIIDAYIDLLKN